MNPIKPVEITFWQCGKCNRRHNVSDLASRCCMCAECEKREATHKEYSTLTWCDICFGRKEREKARRSVRTAEEQVKRAKQRLDDAERELAQERGRFALYAPRKTKEVSS